ncbi:hypothetical protein J4G44_10480 [Acinetobacter towneri]|uniref:hypothetical protein n=1 Tax=Acinetobacter towneri TaxID=202956 RepID=UPI001A9F1BE4|nr:hypothetical protein [Acinetobacter towneri]QTD58730.1 hypothetical protein J4G44_10480 [Acinetobacter towneri]
MNNEVTAVGSYSVVNGAVIFGAAPADGSMITLCRDTKLDRTTNYKTYDNSFRPESVNWDFDKIWHVLQEANIVDAKILARIKEEIEWRRTHDFNYDELAQVREQQLFDALKGYADTLYSATNPNVFQGVIAGVVFARDGKSIQTHIEEILDNLAVSREDIESKASQTYVDEQLSTKAPQATTYTKIEVDNALSLKAPQSNTYTKAEVDTTFAAYVGGRKAYTTLALAQADQVNLTANTAIEVTNDGANNGTYQWNGTTLTKSAYDPLTQAKTYADQGIKDYVVGQNYTGPAQVNRDGMIWELPSGEVANGTEAQSPGVDARWIKKLTTKTLVKLHPDFKPYVTEDGAEKQNRNNSYVNLLDEAIVSIALMGSKVKSYLYACMPLFYIVKNEAAGTCSINIQIKLTNNLNDGDTASDLLLTGFGGPYNIDSNGFIKIYNNASPEKYELVIDTKRFADNVAYLLTASSKKDGLLLTSALEYVDMPYCQGNISDAAGVGSAFAFARAVKFLEAKGDLTNKVIRFSQIQKTATVVQIQFIVYDEIAKTTVTFRKTYTHAEFVGVLNVSPWALAGVDHKSLPYGLALVIDADHLNQHFTGRATWSILPLDANKSVFKEANVSEIRLLDQYDFPSAGYCDYRGYWSETAGYRRMNMGIKIPAGTTSIKATGGFDKNANIVFGDASGRLIEGGYALKNVDGTKYSGDEVITSVDVALPVGAEYLHMATLAANLSTATLNVIGDFKYAPKRDFKTVQDVLLDKTMPDGVYTAQKYLFRKSGTLLNDLQVIDGTNLSLADTYSASSIKKGSSGGQLVFYKDRKHYYYNGVAREIYVEVDGVKTILTNPSMHPTAWSKGVAQQQGRTVIEVLDDDSILFDMLESQANGSQAYSLWKMKVGQEPQRCFMYSHDSYTDSGSVVRSANGCPLGDWSFTYAKGLIFATEYGAGTSEYWYNQATSGGNGRGVSSRVWVSADNGDTWYTCLNLNELKDTAQPISDTNWKYFDSTHDKNMTHIHCIKYDAYADRIYMTNGDSTAGLFSVSIDEVKTWLAAATPVVPTQIPVYAQATGLTWNVVKLNDWQWHTNINYHNMRQQHTAIFPIEHGLLLGHDAAREFMYIAHRNGILNQNTLALEPSYNWESRNDFDESWQFFQSQTLTDGFVMAMVRNKKSDPVLTFHSASGKYCRIWATYNGFGHREVFESTLNEITFGCRAFFDGDGNIILSTGAGTGSWDSGYYLLSVDKI